eukprot:GHVR01139355.1.p1 GENE.GHVR01139355.1~~GHVR01139355.1.p1  ORF type:complete len:342 (+),score=101.72 GHVR01139355.1:95-1120(+)
MTCGPVRNLTGLYIKYRVEGKEKKFRFGTSILGGITSDKSIDGHQRLLANGIEMTSLPPVWVDLIEESQESINKIKDKLGSLQKVQQKRLLKVFDDAAGNRAEVDTLTAQIHELFKNCEMKVQQVSTRGTPPCQQSAHDTRMRENAQRAVAQQLQQLSQSFRVIQKTFAKELEKQQGGVSLIDQSSKGESLAAMFSDTQLIELDHWEQEVHTRNEEITKIAQSVSELSTIFKEVAVLVIDQGTMLDRIDYNLEKCVETTEGAVVQLRRAQQYQKSDRVFKCILILACLIAITILLITVKHSGPRRQIIVSSSNNDIEPPPTHPTGFLSQVDTDTHTHTYIY